MITVWTVEAEPRRGSWLLSGRNTNEVPQEEATSEQEGKLQEDSGSALDLKLHRILRTRLFVTSSPKGLQEGQIDCRKEP